MTQENKELLLKDLCARLPYGVNIQVYYEEIAGSGYFDETVWAVDNDGPFHVNDRWIGNIKPYLRLMSSMTEEEKKEFQAFHCVDGLHPYFYQQMCNLPNLENMMVWLNKHHFDFRGLIEKGLALEAPEDMYKTE